MTKREKAGLLEYRDFLQRNLDYYTSESLKYEHYTLDEIDSLRASSSAYEVALYHLNCLFFGQPDTRHHGLQDC